MIKSQSKDFFLKKQMLTSVVRVRFSNQNSKNKLLKIIVFEITANPLK